VPQAPSLSRVLLGAQPGSLIAGDPLGQGADLELDLQQIGALFGTIGPLICIFELIA
jgi:hypothetical protein